MTHNCSDGVVEIHLERWADFVSFLLNTKNLQSFIWRGQRDSNWLLEPTLRRCLTDLSKASERMEAILKEFRYASRGRRGSSPREIPLDEVNEWWALGQHHGLATPLLDWTHSPYAAAFFAFCEEAQSPDAKRIVFGINQKMLEAKSSEIESEWVNKELIPWSKANSAATDGPQNLGKPPVSKPPPPEKISFVKPLSNENSRLISQNGLFTLSPLSVDIESWVKKHFKHKRQMPVMFKLYFPEGRRETALRTLNQMNINFLSLYPDLIGASLYCNMKIRIENY